MRAVAQRVSSASVEVDHATVGRIEWGLLVYLGAGKGDTLEDVRWTADKVVSLRIFEDEQGRMSRGVQEIGGAVLVVSQFTLYGDVRKGRRPSFEPAAPPEEARVLYEAFCAHVRHAGLPVQTGIFAANMAVHATVAGPVTILIDSRRAF